MLNYALQSQGIKPSPWAWDRGLLTPEGRAVTKNISAIIPLWDASHQPTELISGDVATTFSGAMVDRPDGRAFHQASTATEEIVFPHRPAYELRGQWAMFLSAFKLANGGGSDCYIARRSAFGDSMWEGPYASGNDVAFTYKSPAGDGTAKWGVYDSTVGLNNTLHNILITRDPNDSPVMRLYDNGVEQAQTQADSGTPDTAGGGADDDLVIGRIQAGLASHDVVGYYNCVYIWQGQVNGPAIASALQSDKYLPIRINEDLFQIGALPVIAGGGIINLAGPGGLASVGGLLAGRGGGLVG